MTKETTRCTEEDLAREERQVKRIADSVLAGLAPILLGGGRFMDPSGPGYHCTGSKFGCGEYECETTVHSCNDVFDCTIKFSQ